MKARDGIKAQRGLNDVFPGDEYPSTDAPRTWRSNGKAREYPYRTGLRCAVCTATSTRPKCTLPAGMRCIWTIPADELEP